jgi:hypothetical protein
MLPGPGSEQNPPGHEDWRKKEKQQILHQLLVRGNRIKILLVKSTSGLQFSRRPYWIPSAHVP